MGVHDALRAAGIDAAKVPEFSAHGEEGEFFQATHDVLQLRPRPTAVIAFDDSIGSMVRFQAMRQENIKVPSELSIVSFHEWSYLNFFEPKLTTVRFEFFTAGQKAAEALTHAAQTGQSATDLFFPPTYREGQTIGPAQAIPRDCR